MRSALLHVAAGLALVGVVAAGCQIVSGVGDLEVVEPKGGASGTHGSGNGVTSSGTQGVGGQGGAGQGGAGQGGAGQGGAGQGGGTTSTGGQPCEALQPILNPPECGQCATDLCCPEGSNCVADQGCIDIINCIGACVGDQVCTDNCVTSAPMSAQDDFNAWWGCLGANCPVCGTAGGGICDSGLGTANPPCDMCLSANCCAEFEQCSNFGMDPQACADCFNMGMGPLCDAALACFANACGAECM